MKKLFIVAALLLSLSATAQKDTTIQITVTLNQFRALLFTIDQNIDSKKISKEVLDFLQKSAQIVADKPKQK